MRERERVGPLGRLVRYVLVVALLVGAGAVYWNFDTLREIRVGFGPLEGLLDRKPAGQPAAAGGGTPDTIAVEAAAVAGAAAPTSVGGAPPAAQTAAPEPRPAALPTAEPAPAEPPTAPEPTAAATPPPPAETPPPEPEPPPGPEKFSFGLDRIEVSEASASADLLILRSGDMRRASTVTWWTSDGTATAGQDYASLGRVVVKFAPREQNRGIHVPIIGDRNAEGPETFYLNLAPGDAPAAGPAERIEVVINDDD
jgi:hypothetical protein